MSIGVERTTIMAAAWADSSAERTGESPPISAPAEDGGTLRDMASDVAPGVRPVVLLSATGLLVRSVLKTYELSLGVDTPQVMVMQLPLPGGRYPTSADRLAFLRRLDERLADVNAIEAASTTSNAPLGGGAAVQFSIDGRQSGTAERPPLVTMLAIGSRYFRRSWIAVASWPFVH